MTVLSAVILVLGTIPTASAFCLLGPFAPWMVKENGYRYQNEIGGPMNIGEGYRWNVPVINYAFDRSFLDFFGSRGVAEVEEAVQMLNDLPPASQVDLMNYPLTPVRNNTVAGFLNLLSLKTYALNLLLEQMGLASPARWAFCPDQFQMTPETTDFPVMIRNFDPESLLPSSSVNNIEYVFQNRILRDQFALIHGGFTQPLVTLGPLDYSPNAASILFTSPSAPGPRRGVIARGLTRDDAGGLRYLLSTNNMQWEALIEGVRPHNADADFVRTALRPGVDKITFQRVSFDSATTNGSPIATNVFIDHYFIDGFMQQQVERVITRPDVLFTANNCTPDYYSRSGTERWINNGKSHGHDGPGVIQPPVVINFNPVSTGVLLFLDNIESKETWGAFDGSTNYPKSYSKAAENTGHTTLTVRLTLDRSVSPVYSWDLDEKSHPAYRLESSRDLTNWESLYAITNTGGVVSVDIGGPNKVSAFFRVTPVQ